MASSAVASPPSPSRPSPAAVLELLKPITWFAPMWAFMCGVVSAGGSFSFATFALAAAGAVLAGPLVCGTSQAINDWFDRNVDAINEPDRPIPSGRVPGQWGLRIAIAGSALSLLYALILGVWIFAAAVVGVALAWAYSAPPFRLKRSGWWGPASVGFSYEGLSWFTGAAIIAGGLPDAPVLTLVVLYSIGAFGIMTLNDFKAIEGDRQLGLRSLPVVLGAPTAVRIACGVMVAPQFLVFLLLSIWGLPVYAAIVALGVAAQIMLTPRVLQDPVGQAPWFNATGTTLFVLGMLTSAIGVSGL